MYKFYRADNNWVMGIGYKENDKMSIDQVIFTAPLYKTMKGLADHFGVNVSFLKYRLMKAHKLELVRRIIKQRGEK